MHVAIDAGNQAVTHLQGLAFGERGDGAAALKPGIAHQKSNGADGRRLRCGGLGVSQGHARQHQANGA